MELNREIRVFLATYGRFLFSLLISIAIIIYIIQGLNNIEVKETEERKKLNEGKIIYNIEKVENNNEKLITNFVENCKNKNVEKAYELIDDVCKKEKYNTIEEFKNNFINKYFNIKIDEYKILKYEDEYTIELIQDMLVTGKTESTYKFNLYIVELESKIYIK